MVPWTEQAEELVTAVTETGVDAAALSAAAWRAEVDPAATASITTAAVALYSTPLDLLRGGLVPSENDLELLTSAIDVATVVGEHLHHARHLSNQVTEAARVAGRAAETATHRIREAKQADNQSQAAAAGRELRRALAELDDCEQAMELLTDAGPRLATALDALDAAPDDLLAAYELPYEHIAAGGTFPASNRFLTGAQA